MSRGFSIRVPVRPGGAMATIGHEPGLDGLPEEVEFAQDGRVLRKPAWMTEDTELLKLWQRVLGPTEAFRSPFSASEEMPPEVPEIEIRAERLMEHGAIVFTVAVDRMRHRVALSTTPPKTKGESPASDFAKRSAYQLTKSLRMARKYSQEVRELMTQGYPRGMAEQIVERRSAP